MQGNIVGEQMRIFEQMNQIGSFRWEIRFIRYILLSLIPMVIGINLVRKKSKEEHVRAL